jgi:mono/diheme cytochrome c family protein
MKRSAKRTMLLLAMASGLGLGSLSLDAAAPSVSFGDPARFVVTEGADIYRAACQGCHMPDGQGAVGAGRYPALANNPRLQAAAYPAYVVINGQRAMPEFGSMLNDEQVAAVVRYIRTNFGNQFNEPVTADDVKGFRR